MNADLDRLLAEVSAVLFDFDGPLCSIFAGYPAPRIAAELVDLLRQHDVDVPPDLAIEPDPIEVLRRTGSAGALSITKAMEDALCAAERRAIETARPTPYGREAIVAACEAGMPTAVVSNNSAGAINAYLAAHRLTSHVLAVVGRAYADPTLMKPNPAPILQAMSAIREPASRCVLVGDSLADIRGAQASGIRVIGYANHPAKVEIFRAAGADAIVDSMRDIADAIIS